MVGRTSELSILDYLSHYIGSPIINFNSFLENPIRNTQIFGKETFWGIYDVLGKLFKKVSIYMIIHLSLIQLIVSV